MNILVKKQRPNPIDLLRHPWTEVQDAFTITGMTGLKSKFKLRKTFFSFCTTMIK